MSNPFDPGAADPRASASGPAGLEPVPLDVGAVLARCVELVQREPFVVIGAVVIPILVQLPFTAFQVALQMLTQDADDVATALGAALLYVAVSLASVIVLTFFNLGAMRIYWNVATGRPANLLMIAGEGRSYLAGLGTMFLTMLVVVVGLLFLIVPGIIAGLGLGMAMYEVIVRDRGPIEALQGSWEITDGHKGFLFLFYLVMIIGLTIVSCCTCGLGYLAALPVLGLVQAVIYQSLLAQRGALP